MKMDKIIKHKQIDIKSIIENAKKQASDAHICTFDIK